MPCAHLGPSKCLLLLSSLYDALRIRPHSVHESATARCSSASAMPTEHMPMTLLLKEEREGHRRLLQLAIRQERLVELFHEQLAQVDAERAEVIASLSSVRSAIHSNQRRIALLDCPPELREWQAFNTPPVDSKEVELVLQLGTGQDDAVMGIFHGTRASLPLTASERAAVEAHIVANSMPRLQKVQIPDVLQRKAFVPYFHEAQKRYLRRPCAGDIAVMQSNAPPLGRVLVTLRDQDAGGVIFAESPWMVVEADVAADVDLLPPVLAEVYRSIATHDDVFQAQPLWDRHLVLPLLVLVERMLQGRGGSHTEHDADTVDATLLPHLLRTLCNPLKDMEPERVEALCAFAQFLRTALPPRLQSLLTEDEIVKFLSTFAVNAASFQGGDGALYLRATMPPSSVGASVYACCPSTRCLLGLASMLEHSCRPNAALVLHRTNSLGDESSVVVEVRALRRIVAGERLSLAYIPTTLPREERQRLLWSRYCFHCTCAHCSHGVDLLRAMRVPTHANGDGANDTLPHHQLIAPVGSGKLWMVVGDQDANNAVPLHDDVVRAAVREEALRVPGGTDDHAQGEPGLLLQLLQPGHGVQSSLLGFSHHRRFSAFVTLCMRLADAASPTSASLRQCIEATFGYVRWVTEESFVQFDDASLCRLLEAPQPLAWFFNGVGDSKSSRRQRLTGASSRGTEHASGSVDVAAHAVRFVEPRLGDVGALAVQLCAAVWEACYALVHNLMKRIPAEIDGEVSAILPSRRCALALGVWLMHKYALQGQGSAKCLHYQGVLLEEDERF